MSNETPYASVTEARVLEDEFSSLFGFDSCELYTNQSGKLKIQFNAATLLVVQTQDDRFDGNTLIFDVEGRKYEIGVSKRASDESQSQSYLPKRPAA